MAPQLFQPPNQYTYPFSREPMFDTRRFPAVSGKESRLAIKVFTTYRWTLPFEYARTDATLQEFQYLLGWYNQMQGPATPWLFTDPDDNAVVNQTFAIGDGVSTAFGLIRTLAGSVDPVYAPVAAGIKFFDNGVDETANVTLGNSGLATFNYTPTSGHVLSWTGSFNWLVWFDDDTLSFTKEYATIYSVKKFAFSSRLVPWT